MDINIQMNGVRLTRVVKKKKERGKEGNKERWKQVQATNQESKVT